MSRSQVILLLILTLATVGHCLAADEVRYYEENGITYRETRQLSSQTVASPAPQTQAKTAAGQQWATEQREFLRTCYVATTGYRAETYWVGLWNPFDEPYLATRYVPVTYYQAQTQRVSMPVAVCKTVPGSQVAASPKSQCRQSVSRVAVYAAPGADAASSTQMARRSEPRSSEPVARMAAVPPRYTPNTAASGVVPPNSIPTPTYTRSAPAPAYSPTGGYSAPVTGGYAAPVYSPSAAPSSAPPAYAPPGGMSYGGQAIGGVSRLDKGPTPWGSR